MANPPNGHDTLDKLSWAEIYELLAVDEPFEFLHGKVGHTEKTPWSVEELLKVIVGVLSTTEPGRRKRWKEIVEKYFKGERTEEQLKQKWKDLKKYARKKRDGEQQLFYMMAAIVEVEIQSDERTEFEKVIQEWYVTSNQAKLARNWLNEVKNVELKLQLDAIKFHVRAAEMSQAYDEIRYWRNPVHP